MKCRPIRKVRTRNERYDPGGGGINVSRVLRELGGETFAIYLAGGATGPVFDALIDAEGVPRKRIDISGHTRISNTVFETSSGHEFRFVPEGPLVRARTNASKASKRCGRASSTGSSPAAACRAASARDSMCRLARWRASAARASCSTRPETR